MNTKIIYEVNENWDGIGKDWSLRVIGLFDNITAVEFLDGEGYAIFEGAFYSEKLEKVTLKFTSKIERFDNLIDTINTFAAEVSRRRFNSAI